MAGFAPKVKLGPKKVPQGPKAPNFVRGSRPSSLIQPHPRGLSARDYGKTAPSAMPMTGFGNTGMEGMPDLTKVKP